jgi:hypothetical protein
VTVVAAYAAATVAFTYALVSLYWAFGGLGLVSTVGGYVQQFARRGGVNAVLVAAAATLAKVLGGLLALALVRPWGRAVPRRWLLALAVVASAVLVVYGAANVAGAALTLSGAVHPSGAVDRNALRWHLELWDLWFLLWGLALAVATEGYRRRTADTDPRSSQGLSGPEPAGGDAP